MVHTPSPHPPENKEIPEALDIAIAVVADWFSEKINKEPMLVDDRSLSDECMAIFKDALISLLREKYQLDKTKILSDLEGCFKPFSTFDLITHLNPLQRRHLNSIRESDAPITGVNDIPRLYGYFFSQYLNASMGTNNGQATDELEMALKKAGISPHRLPNKLSLSLRNGVVQTRGHYQGSLDLIHVPSSPVSHEYLEYAKQEKAALDKKYLAFIPDLLFDAPDRAKIYRDKLKPLLSSGKSSFLLSYRDFQAFRLSESPPQCLSSIDELRKEFKAGFLDEKDDKGLGEILEAYNLCVKIHYADEYSSRLAALHLDMLQAGINKSPEELESL